MGSVKDLEIVERPQGMKVGRGRFHFSDRYSVFDWGEMPDHIEGKGEALCIMGAYFFETLAEMGIESHYLGVVREDGEARNLRELEGPARVMEVRLLRVIEPQVKDGEYDYAAYREEKGNFLIPLEIIYRNSLPAGSSVFKRLEEGSLSVEELGLDRHPAPGEKLESPILDVSTKLESTDRYLGWEEAREIAGLTREEVEKMKDVVLRVNEVISRAVEPLGLVNQDGKVEFGFDGERNLILVDVLGTPDECRFEFNGMPVSKELARIFYRETDWSREVEAAKRSNRFDWKSLVSNKPPLLPPGLRRLISQLYQGCCDGITGRTFFNAPPLAEILSQLDEELQGLSTSQLP